MNEDAVARKRLMRHEVRLRLTSMSDLNRKSASRQACERLIEMSQFQHAELIMAYLSLPGEVDCTLLIERQLSLGKGIAVPHVEWANRSMQPVRLTSLDEASLRVDRYGVRSPLTIDPVPIKSIETVVVPGMAFDERGHRLGRGGGFYDRLLAALPPTTRTIGLAFDEQIVADLPVELHDARVQIVATPTRLVECG